MRERVLTLEEVAEILAISMTQAYSLVKHGELKAFQLGGRRVWRVEPAELELYITRAYAQTQAGLRDRLAEETR